MRWSKSNVLGTFFVGSDRVLPDIVESVKHGIIVEVDGEEGTVDIWAFD